MKFFYFDDVVFPDGYDQLIEYLAKGLDILLNVVVTEIVYENYHEPLDDRVFCG
jgi:hypothetical protein